MSLTTPYDSRMDKFIALQEHHKAIEQEFAALDLKPEDTPDEIRTKCRTWAVTNLQAALSTIADLVTEAEKETTQLAAAKTVIQIAHGTSPKDEADPLSKLFKDLVDKAT